MTSNDQRAHYVAVLDRDRIDEDTPFDAEHHTRERPKGDLTRQLLANSITYGVESALGVSAHERFELETRDGLGEIRHNGDDLCTGNDLEEGFDDQTRLFAGAVQIRVVETSHREIYLRRNIKAWIRG